MNNIYIPNMINNTVNSVNTDAVLREHNTYYCKL